MLNEPAFEKAGEVQASGAVAFDHIEGQAAVSLTNHIGLLGGAYRGFAGINIYDVGLNFYTPISKNSRYNFSTTIGFTDGTYKGGNGYSVPISFSKGATIDNKYNSTFMQFAFIRKRISESRTNKTIFLMKFDFLKFSKYDVIITESTGQNVNSYEIRQTAENKRAILFRPAIVHHLQKRNSLFFWQIQYGLNVVKGFKIEDITRVSGNPNSLNQYRKPLPKVFPTFLNVTLGIKL
jgi:hypothetical protein